MTIKEVAQIAGVSSAAVSRYMNGGSLSEEKKTRIRRAIEETGYRPNRMAQTMRTGRINQIGVIVPKVNSESVSQVAGGATDQLFSDGYMTVLGCTQSDQEKELRYLDIMRSNQVAGILLMGTTLNEQKARAMRESGLPIVITGQNYPGFSCVYHDDFHAVKELTGRMLRRGRRRIVYIGVTEEDAAAGVARRRGAQAAFGEAGLDASCMQIVISEFSGKDGHDHMLALLDQIPGIDGVVCATDTIALGAMAALRQRGLHIPEEVSISGVGGSWAGELSWPPLTTAKLEFYRCGEAAAKMLLDSIDNPDLPDRQLMLPYTILERGSL